MEPYYEENGIVIYHGDCREVLPSVSHVDLVLTDPPFGVQWRSNRRKVRHDLIQNDDGLAWIEDVFAGLYGCMKPDALCFTFYGWPDADRFVATWKEIGFQLKSHVVWVKGNIGLGWFTRGQHEVAYLLTKGSPSKPRRAMSDVIFAETTGNELHPTQKPESLCRDVLTGLSVEGDLILDPFMGSGTTLVAAKRLGRRAIGIEIEEKYCEIAAKQLSQGALNFNPEQIAIEATA